MDLTFDRQQRPHHHLTASDEKGILTVVDALNQPSFLYNVGSGSGQISFPHERDVGTCERVTACVARLIRTQYEGRIRVVCVVSPGRILEFANEVGRGVACSIHITDNFVIPNDISCSDDTVILFGMPDVNKYKTHVAIGSFPTNVRTVTIVPEMDRFPPPRIRRRRHGKGNEA